MHVSRDTSSNGAQLPQAPSLRQALIDRKVPGAEYFDDEYVESFDIAGDLLRVQFKEAFSREISKGLTLHIDSVLTARFVDSGIADVTGLSASKKMLVTLKAGIMSIKLEGEDVIVQTDNPILSSFSVPLSMISEG